MSSYTVSLTGSSSVLRSSLFPALRLRTDRDWEAALLDFTTYNSIPNITEDVNDKFYFYKSKDNDGNYTSPEVLSLKTGSYEIEDIEKELKKHMGEDNIELKANNSILRVEIMSKYYIDFTKPDCIGLMLGFPQTTTVLEPHITHTSPQTVDIIKVNVLNITCNIIQGSYKDGVNQHILHTFYPIVPPGFKIVEKPHNLVYLPLNTSYISDIELNVIDQDGNIVDFRGEVISVRIHIKQIA